MLFHPRACSCTVALLLSLASAARAQTPPAKIVLAAEQSTGGKIVAFSAGGKGVALDKSCETAGKSDVCIEWKLPAPLPPGWWRGQVEFGPREGDDKGWVNYHLGFVLMTGPKPLVSIMSNFRFEEKARPPYRFDFWIHTSAPAPAVRIQPIYDDLWRYKRTWPIVQVSLEPVANPALAPQDALTVELPVAADGSVNLPGALPPGNWSLHAPMTKDGAVTCRIPNGRSIQAPFSFDRWRRPGSICFYAEAPLEYVSFKTAAMFGHVVLKHNSLRTAEPIVVEHDLITTVDPAKTQSAQLELIGQNLTGEPPAFALFPGGKKIAVLTSWDDGAPPDLRLAQILNKLGYHPSFFLNHNNPAMKFLDKLEALNVEVGSHCYHHPSLFELPPDRALEECVTMRKLLEKELKHPVISLGYPNGYTPAFDPDGDYVLRAVRAAGYWSARTTATPSEAIEAIAQPLAMKTDGFFGDAKGLERAWEQTLRKEGGIFYFWGHSWQIGKTDEQWQKFEDFAAKFANHPEAWYASQGELALWIWARQHTRFAIAEKTPAKITLQVSRPWLHPWLAAKCPFSVKLPPGVQKVLWQGKELPITEGRIDLKDGLSF